MRNKEITSEKLKHPPWIDPKDPQWPLWGVGHWGKNQLRLMSQRGSFETTDGFFCAETEFFPQKLIFSD